MVDVRPKRRDTEGTEAALHVAGGSHQTAVESLSGGMKKGAFDLYAAQSWVSTEGHRDHSRAQQQNYFANLGYALTSHWDARLVLNHTDAQTLAPAPDTLPAADNGVSYPTAERFDTRSTLATLTLAHRYDHMSGTFKIYQDDTKFDLLGELSSGKPNGKWTRQAIKLYGARARETMHLWRGGELVAGFDLDYADLTNTQTVSATGAKTEWDFPNLRQFSPYLGVNQTWGDDEGWHVTPSAGFRYYDHNAFGDKSAPQAGVVVGYGKTDVNINAARGVNYPSPVTLQGLVNTPGGDAAWQDKLKAEVVNHIEVGVTHAFALGSAQATVFYDKGKDRFRVYMGGPMPTVWNDPVGDYTIKGLELSGSVKPMKGLTLTAGATWLDAEATGENGVTRDHLPYTPDFTLQLGANWQINERVNAHLDAQHMRGLYQGTTMRTGGFNFNPANDADKLDNITLVNARVAYQVGAMGAWVKDAEIYLAVDNLLDKKVEYAKGYPMPGITAMVGVNLKF
jgi:iron complex outermembrane receptor protein